MSEELNITIIGTYTCPVPDAREYQQIRLVSYHPHDSPEVEFWDDQDNEWIGIGDTPPEVCIWLRALIFSRSKMKAQLAALQEQSAQQLAACDCAAIQDTPETHEQNKGVVQGNPFWSPAFDSVMRRTAECIDLRAQLAAAEKARTEAEAKLAKIVADVIRQGGMPSFNLATAELESVCIRTPEAMLYIDSPTLAALLAQEAKP